jgi:hypothetical protein
MSRPACWSLLVMHPPSCRSTCLPAASPSVLFKRSTHHSLPPTPVCCTHTRHTAGPPNTVALSGSCTTATYTSPDGLVGPTTITAPLTVYETLSASNSHNCTWVGGFPRADRQCHPVPGGPRDRQLHARRGQRLCQVVDPPALQLISFVGFFFVWCSNHNKGCCWSSVRAGAHAI